MASINEIDTREAFTGFLRTLSLSDQLIIRGVLELGSVERYARGDQKLIDYCQKRLDALYPRFKACMGVA